MGQGGGNLLYRVQEVAPSCGCNLWGGNALQATVALDKLQEAVGPSAYGRQCNVHILAGYLALFIVFLQGVGKRYYGGERVHYLVREYSYKALLRHNFALLEYGCNALQGIEAVLYAAYKHSACHSGIFALFATACRECEQCAAPLAQPFQLRGQ